VSCSSKDKNNDFSLLSVKNQRKKLYNQHSLILKYKIYEQLLIKKSILFSSHLKFKVFIHELRNTINILDFIKFCLCFLHLKMIIILVFKKNLNWLMFSLFSEILKKEIPIFLFNHLENLIIYLLKLRKKISIFS